LPGKRESLPYPAVMLAGTRDLMIQAKPLKVVDADSGGEPTRAINFLRNTFFRLFKKSISSARVPPC
jgi:hypothetical protein